MGYEKMKAWGFEQKRKQFQKAGREWTAADDKLVGPEWVTMIFETLTTPTVQHGVHRYVGRKQTVRTIRHVSVPGCAIKNTSESASLLGFLETEHSILARIMPQITCILPFPSVSNARSLKKVSEGSTAALEPILFECYLEHVLPSWSMRISPGSCGVRQHGETRLWPRRQSLESLLR